MNPKFKATGYMVYSYEVDAATKLKTNYEFYLFTLDKYTAYLNRSNLSKPDKLFEVVPVGLV